MKFIFQRGNFMTFEKKAIRYASIVNDNISIVDQFDIEQLKTVAFKQLEHLRDCCCIGTVNFCQLWMNAVGVEQPEPIDYPQSLQYALGRELVLSTYDKVRIGYWVKPYKTKLFDSHIKQYNDQHYKDELVWSCEPIKDKILSEWRFYCLEGQVIGWGCYDSIEDKEFQPDINKINQWVNDYVNSGEAPIGFALDVAVIENDEKLKTILIEVNDGWALGYYKGNCVQPLYKDTIYLSQVDYAKLLYKRWMEICCL